VSGVQVGEGGGKCGQVAGGGLAGAAVLGMARAVGSAPPYLAMPQQSHAETIARSSPELDRRQFSTLHAQFRACAPLQESWFLVRDADETRYNIWANQSPDGRKHKDLFPDGGFDGPWDRSSDFRPGWVDDIINAKVALDCEAWDRAFRVQAHKPEDAGQSARVRMWFEYLRKSRLLNEIQRERELSSQWRHQYGACLVKVEWDCQLAYVPRVVTLTDLMEAGATAAEFAPFFETIKDPSLDAENANYLELLYQTYVRASVPLRLGFEPAALTEERVKRALTELRERQETVLPMPELVRNVPMARALKLGRQVFVPRGTTDIQGAAVIFELEWLTLAEAEGMARVEGWSEDFTEKLKQHVGEYSEWRRDDAGDLRFVTYQDEDADPRVQIIRAYRKQVDEQGVLGIYETVFHHAIEVCRDEESGETEPLYAKHGLFETPLGTRYPFVELRAEWNDRALLASRGVPRMLASHETQIKSHMDMVTNHADITTLPPVNEPDYAGGVGLAMGVGKGRGAKEVAGYDYSPFAKNTIWRAENKPEFMQPPAREPKVALELMTMIRTDMLRRAGLPVPDEHPAVANARLPHNIAKFLTGWSEVFQMMWQMTARYLEDRDWQRVVGNDAPPLNRDPRVIEAEFDYIMEFDARTLDPEFLTEQNKALAAIAQGDRNGVIDGAEITRLQVQLWNPAWADRIIKDQRNATAELRRKVRQDLDSMWNGSPPELVENDPTAGMQMEFAQQFIGQNPFWASAMTQDGGSPQAQVFRQHVEQWLKNRQQSVVETGLAQMAGRTGVMPVAPGLQMGG